MNHPPRVSRAQRAKLGSVAAGALALALASTTALAAEPAAPPVRLRGSVEQFDAKSLVIHERSGERITLAVPADVGVLESVPMDVAKIKSGDFVGVAAMGGGSAGPMRSLEVVVFPEAARGTGEGHYAWDLLPESTMTNATVTGVVGGGGGSGGEGGAKTGRTLQLHYTDPKTGAGDKTIVVPDGTPVVTFKPGTAAMLKPGAKVFVFAADVSGTPTARRIVVGHDGVAPPM